MSAIKVFHVGEVRMPEVGAFAKSAAIEDPEIRGAQVASAQVRVAQICALKVAAIEIGAVKLRVRQAGMPEICA
jgi:hypothetical protein